MALKTLYVEACSMVAFERAGVRFLTYASLVGRLVAGFFQPGGQDSRESRLQLKSVKDVGDAGETRPGSPLCGLVF